jgi:hypothetical protein
MNKATSKYKLLILSIFIVCFFLIISIDAHVVDAITKYFLMEKKGVAFGSFLYIGAKHMITGYNHFTISCRSHFLSIQAKINSSVCEFLYYRTQFHITFWCNGRHSSKCLFNRCNHSIGYFL